MLGVRVHMVPLEEAPYRAAAARDRPLRLAATISSSVKSGCSANNTSKKSAWGAARII